MEDIIYDWEIKIDESRKKHKHKVSAGGFKDADLKNLRYCYSCDQYYYNEVLKSKWNV